MRDQRAAYLLAATTMLAAATAAVATLRYPGARIGLSPVLVGTAVLLAAYLGYAAHVARRGSPSDRSLGPWFGIAAAACWSGEIWAGGPARLGHVAEKATGATLSLAATAVTVAAGIVTATRARRAGQVWHAGLLAGTISGALVYVFAVMMTMATLRTLGLRSDYQAQFASGHLPTMPDFLVNDILGAGAAHLVINVALGALGAAAGRIVLAFRRRSDRDRRVVQVA